MSNQPFASPGWVTLTSTTDRTDGLTLEQVRAEVVRYLRADAASWIDDFCAHLEREMAKAGG